MRNKNAKISDPNSFVSCSGDFFHVEFSPVILPDGCVELVECGQTDIQDFIDSFRDMTDMSFILSRIAAGDASVLNSKEPMYGDFTSMPKTYAEALQLVIDSESQFASLPSDVRNQFDNDFRKWFATAGSDSWIEKMKSVISVNDKVESEVVSNES